MFSIKTTAETQKLPAPSMSSKTTSPDHPAPDAALLLDLFAEMFRCGIPLTSALSHLGRTQPGTQSLTAVATYLRLGMSWDESWEPVYGISELETFGRELHFVHISAAPSAQLLQSIATALRTQRKRRAEQLAAELGIKLVIPMGVCLLPSFICLGVLPLLISLLPQI